jgi:hypothetical protein
MQTRVIIEPCPFLEKSSNLWKKLNEKLQTLKLYGINIGLVKSSLLRSCTKNTPCKMPAA